MRVETQTRLARFRYSKRRIKLGLLELSLCCGKLAATPCPNEATPCVANFPIQAPPSSQ